MSTGHDISTRTGLAAYRAALADTRRTEAPRGGIAQRARRTPHARTRPPVGVTDDDLRAAHQAVLDADAAATAARDRRTALVRQARADGATIYHIAATLGVSQNAVRYMLGL